MSLKVYTDRSKVPVGLDIIDNVGLYSDVATDLNIGRSGLNSDAKIIQNIVDCRDKCFNVTECSDAVLFSLSHLSRGTVLWEKAALDSKFDSFCDIILNDTKHFDSFFDFLDAASAEE